MTKKDTSKSLIHLANIFFFGIFEGLVPCSLASSIIVEQWTLPFWVLVFGVCPVLYSLWKPESLLFVCCVLKFPDHRPWYTSIFIRCGRFLVNSFNLVTYVFQFWKFFLDCFIDDGAHILPHPHPETPLSFWSLYLDLNFLN